MKVCCTLAEVCPTNNFMQYLGHFIKIFQCKRGLFDLSNTVCMMLSLEGTEMQQVDCFNIWELYASSTLPAALLHPSDEQQVG
jgi:hypothetical protein